MAHRKKAADQLDEMAVDTTSVEVILADDDTEVSVVESPDPALVDHDADAHAEADANHDADDHEPSAVDELKRRYAQREEELRKEREAHAATRANADRLERAAASSDEAYRQASLTAIENAERLVASDIALIQGAMQHAATSGDWGKHTELQNALTQATLQKRELDAAKRNIGAPGGQRITGDDEYEAKISGFSEPSKAWLRKHKADINNNPQRAQMAKTASELAVMRGFKEDSPEYFAFVDEQMGYMTDTRKAPAPAPRPKSGAPAAPASNGGFNPGAPAAPRNARQVRLTQAQQNAAKAMYSHLSPAEAMAEYAKGVVSINNNETGLRWSKDKYRGGVGV